MSSGNPFRASLLYNPASSSPVPQASFITPDSGVSEAREDGRSGYEDSGAPPPKTKKQVRIESETTFIPPHPDTDDVDDALHSALVQRPSQTEYVASLAPISSVSLPNSEVCVGIIQAQDTPQEIEMATSDMMTSSGREYRAPHSAISPSGIPANPFSRTLASIEPQERTSGEDRTATGQALPGNNRASLDVESFKNLLMTGKPGPRPSGRPSPTKGSLNVPNGAQFESSSSTDTSSTSRQSLFDPPHETHPESPRTSYEMAESEEDESMGLVSEVRKGKKKPPPAPKHRHGKLVTPRQPQIVSFDSFVATEPASSPVTRARDNSDMNKPLPPTPVVSPPPLHISTQDTSQRPPALQHRSSESIPIPDTPQSQKRVPPPVPLARRQSQLRTPGASNRSRSNSSLTMSSQQSTDASLPSPAPNNKDPLSNPKAPPPPPRSRHGARLADISTSSASSSNTELPQWSTSVRTATPTQGMTRRSTVDSEPAATAADMRRTSSVSSNRNTQRVVSNESAGSTGSAMLPPAPPPRRRQGNRSSFDQGRPDNPSSSPIESRRTSTEHRRTSLESKRRTSVASESSLRREYAPPDEKGGNEYALYSPQEESENKLGADADVDVGVPTTRSDSNNILDDMEKFQREIDELTQRLKQAG